MQSHVGHIQFNVQPTHLPFYKGLMAFLGWQVVHEAEGILGVADDGNTSLWFVGQVKPVTNDYDGPGMNHLGLGVAAQTDVDAVATHLTDRGVKLLFDTPRHRPEFADGAENTYYQVMFESPDRILWEVVYTGPKAG